MLTPSNFRGRPKVQRSIEAVARLMDEGEEDLAERAVTSSCRDLPQLVA